MKTKLRTVAEVINNNMRIFMERGPGLDSRYRSFVVARNPSEKKILLGGLGGLGVGEMWFDEEPRHKSYPGYREAKIIRRKRNARLQK